MKTYVIIVSRTFPATHKRAGQPTGFETAIFSKEKLHTIRSNYPDWEKRIKDVQEGKARISIRVWSGRPYCSPQVELKSLTKEDGIGIQKLICEQWRKPRLLDLWERYFVETEFGKTVIPLIYLSKNDGLMQYDFINWFEKYDKSQPMAIIHFTSFRY